jgi:hypothetical protein
MSGIEDVLVIRQVLNHATVDDTIKGTTHGFDALHQSIINADSVLGGKKPDLAHELSERSWLERLWIAPKPLVEYELKQRGTRGRALNVNVVFPKSLELGALARQGKETGARSALSLVISLLNDAHTRILFAGRLSGVVRAIICRARVIVR